MLTSLPALLRFSCPQCTNFILSTRSGEECELWASLPPNIVTAFTRLAEMQPKTKNIAQLKKALDRVSRCRLLDAGDLVTVEASGPGYFPDAPLASCLAHRCANLFSCHASFAMRSERGTPFVRCLPMCWPR